MTRRSRRDRGVKLNRTAIRALMIAAADGIVVIDHKGEILDFNPAAQRMFGFAPEEIIGRNVALLMPEPDRSRHDGYIARYLKTGEKRIIGIGREVTGQRADGTVFPVQLSVGEANGLFIGIIRDLSARKAAEEENQRLKDRLIEVDRFSLMGEMAAGLAHEINQPLSAIATYAQAGVRFMSLEKIDRQTLLRTWQEVADQALRAGQIIHNLRNFVGQREVGGSMVEINRAIEAVLNLVEADASAAGIPVRTEYSADLPLVAANTVHLQQVVLNLTRNAVDAMRRETKKERGIRIRTRRSGNQSVCLEVIDHGHGYPREIEDEMFKPFVTTKRNGLGLGLAISRRIVTGYGGRLTFRPNPGGGSIFGFSLPAGRPLKDPSHGSK